MSGERMGADAGSARGTDEEGRGAHDRGVAERAGADEGVDVVVPTPSGRVRGRWEPVGSPTSLALGRPRATVAAFRGIPYAEAPVGDLRFAAPVPIAPWDGVRDVREPGPTPQRVGDPRALIPEPSVPGDEILNVTVLTPDPSPAARLPVLVWIHGGGYTTGSPASPWYGNGAFARDGVVTVLVSYRLGFDGFGWIEGAPQNRGVRDWLCALEWVQRHVAAFGGDPDHVTVAGQSAGGGAVLTLLGMRAAAGLLARAWAASPALADVPEQTARALAARLGDRLGIGAHGGVPTLEVLRRAGERDVLRAQPGARRGAGRGLYRLADELLALGPVVDGDLLEQPTLDALAAGAGRTVPLVVGGMHDELLLTDALAPRWLRVALRAIPPAVTLGAAHVDRATRRAYVAANSDAADEGAGGLAARYLSDLVFGGTIVGAASARERAAHPHAQERRRLEHPDAAVRAGVAEPPPAGPTAATWTYRFDWASPTRGGAVHCVDVPFAFDALGDDHADRLVGADAPQALADVVHGAMARFAEHGDPGWQPWSEAPGATRILGASDALAPGARAPIVDAAGWSRVAPLIASGIAPRRPRAH
ncbi:carboxylesterase family protein [Agrococcus sp. SGAir0287]|uniref:carboxylesterase family protein n=1 Tax=Agrococcus sp. SGAir0287 TaxID=2070347 RepID=UPI0020C782D4|nr:carboxylesterase family protein [Agrococcus sp. SGAir0287]